MAQNTRNVIEDTIRARLSADAVSAIWLRESVDNDGVPVFRITVVLKKPLRSINRRDMVSLTRHIMAAIEDERFPLIEFISEGDAKKREAA